MPIYEYVCSACHHRTDILHGIYEDGPTFCPSCGAEGTMRKAFAAPAIHYKGTGWAKKERSTASRTKAAAAESGAGGRDGSDKGGSDKSGSEKGESDKAGADKGRTDSGDSGSKQAATSSSGSDGGD